MLSSSKREASICIMVRPTVCIMVDPETPESDELEEDLFLGTWIPIAGALWGGTICKIVILAMRSDDGYDWWGCVQRTDISDVFADTYFTTVFINTIQVILLITFNEALTRVNAKTNYFFGQTQGRILHTLILSAAVGLQGILLFPVTSWHLCHYASAGIALLSLLIYFVFSAILFTLRIIQEPFTNRIWIEFLAVAYWGAVTVLFIAGAIWWRTGRAAEDPLCAKWEWLMMVCVHFWFVPYFFLFRELRGKLDEIRERKRETLFSLLQELSLIREGNDVEVSYDVL